MNKKQKRILISIVIVVLLAMAVEYLVLGSREGKTITAPAVKIK